MSSQSVSFHEEDVDRGGVLGLFDEVMAKCERRTGGEGGGERGLRGRRCWASLGFASG